MQVHGSGELNRDPHPDDPQLVDLDAVAADEKESAQADVERGDNDQQAIANARRSGDQAIGCSDQCPLFAWL
jgi:hypothetical protein